jgi:hypothetical protein
LAIGAKSSGDWRATFVLRPANQQEIMAPGEPCHLIFTIRPVKIDLDGALIDPLDALNCRGRREQGREMDAGGVAC